MTLSPPVESHLPVDMCMSASQHQQPTLDVLSSTRLSNMHRGSVAFLYITFTNKYTVTLRIKRNTLDCNQSNYFSRIVFSHIPNEFGQTGNSAILSADPENPTVEPNVKWIGRPLAEISPFEIFPNVRSVVGRSSVRRRSVLNIYFFLH